MAQKTGMILLAAGASPGKGKVRQLHTAEEYEQALNLCIGRILAAGISKIVVVAGYDQTSLSTSLQDPRVKTIINSEPDDRQDGSLRAGIAALPSRITGILIGMVDYPYALSPTYALLENVHRYRPDRILIPTYRSHDGHPALFPASLCRPDKNFYPPAKILDAHPDRVVRLGVEDPGVVMHTNDAAEYSLAAV